MSDVIIPYRFLVRGGTAAALAATNEIVKSRELEIETDTGKFKLGDGVTHYNDLPYIAPGFFNLSGLSDGDQLYWDAGAGEWVVAPGGGLPITNAGDLIYGLADSSGAVSAERLPIGTSGQALLVSPSGVPYWGAAGGSGPSANGGISIQGGSLTLVDPLPVGFVIDVEVPAGYTLSGGWDLAVLPSGSLTLDVRKNAFPTIPATSSIVAAAPPTVSAATNNTSATNTGWTTGVNRGDMLRVYVSSVTNVKWFSLFLRAIRT